MQLRARRSTGVSSTMSATLDPPTSAGPAPLDFDALYREARDDVYAYVVTLLRSPSAAEDVTAQAFERAFRRAKTYDPGKGGPRAWLFGIARNAGLDNAELAAVLGVSVSNAGTQLHRAMTKLRRAVDDRS